MSANSGKINLKFIQDHFVSFNINLKSNNKSFDNVNLKKNMFQKLSKFKLNNDNNETGTLNTNAENEDLINKTKKLLETIKQRQKRTEQKLESNENNSNRPSTLSSEEYTKWSEEDNDTEKINEYVKRLSVSKNKDNIQLWNIFEKIYKDKNGKNLDPHTIILDRLIEYLLNDTKLKNDLISKLNNEIKNYAVSKQKEIIIKLIEWIIVKGPPSKIGSDRGTTFSSFRYIDTPGIVALITLQNTATKLNEFIDNNTSAEDFRYINESNITICSKTYGDDNDALIVPKFIKYNDELFNDIFKTSDDNLSDEQISTIILDAKFILKIIREKRDQYQQIQSYYNNLLNNTKQKGGNKFFNFSEELEGEDIKLVLKNIEKLFKEIINGEKLNKNVEKFNKKYLSKLKLIQQDIVIHNLNYVVNKLINKKNIQNENFELTVNNKDFKIDSYSIKYNTERITDDIISNRWFTSNSLNVINNQNNIQDLFDEICKKTEFNELRTNPEVFIIIYPNNCSKSEIKRNNCQMNKLKMKIYSTYLVKGINYGESQETIEDKLNILVNNEIRNSGLDGCGDKKKENQNTSNNVTIKNNSKFNIKAKTKKNIK